MPPSADVADVFTFNFALFLVVLALGALVGRYSRTRSEREAVPVGRATGGAPRASRSDLISEECTTIHGHEECEWLECSCQCHLVEQKRTFADRLADLQELGYPESSDTRKEES